MDEQLLIRLAQIAIRCVVAYYVYKDAIKHEVPNKNFWVAATFIFWPVVVVYLFYRQRAARTVDLSFEQKAQLEIDHKREEEKRRIAAERAEMEIERACGTGKTACRTVKAERKEAAGNRGKESQQPGQVVGYISLRALRLQAWRFLFCTQGAVEFFFVSSC